MSNMKCPYCNSELRTFMLEEPAVWYCPNRCAPMLPPKIWQDLIAGKRAKWWLHEIVESHRCTPISTAEMALKEITALEQKNHFADASKKVKQKDE